MRRRSLAFLVFVAIVSVALTSVSVTGLVVRGTFENAFEAYLTVPHMRPDGTMVPPLGGMGLGRGMMLGAAERTFLNAVDRGIVVAALVAVGIAAVAATLLARRLTRPISRLTAATQALAAGELGHRVETEGPAEVVELGRAFNEMADGLDRAEELRRRLVADVAHELRNPVASLRAQAEGMAEGVLPVDEARLKSVVSDLEHLSHLVDDLQELSVAEAGRLAYDMRRLDVGALAAREGERARDLLPEGVALEVQTAPDLPRVVGDEMRLAQVLRNLLGNAARHTERGSITLACTREDGDVRVEVRDTGEGIPEADLPHIFERFYRADSARAAGTGGAGIGLAISRSIVRDHGGEVFALSVPGAGTTVGFRLPAAVS
ncbi:MAG: two-component sensor histidine kinase [Coriobacteriaceae bacterium]|nr:two-component sensor histidine kinase [Coriobacteriaceae bacterium]